MVTALKEVRIRGEIRTIVDYVTDLIQTRDFLGNSIHTGWLDSRIASHVSHTACVLSCVFRPVYRPLELHPIVDLTSISKLLVSEMTSVTALFATYGVSWAGHFVCHGQAPCRAC